MLIVRRMVLETQQEDSIAEGCYFCTMPGSPLTMVFKFIYCEIRVILLWFHPKYYCFPDTML